MLTPHTHQHTGIKHENNGFKRIDNDDQNGIYEEMNNDHPPPHRQAVSQHPRSEPQLRNTYQNQPLTSANDAYDDTTVENSELYVEPMAHHKPPNPRGRYNPMIQHKKNNLGPPPARRSPMPPPRL